MDDYIKRALGRMPKFIDKIVNDMESHGIEKNKIDEFRKNCTADYEKGLKEDFPEYYDKCLKTNKS